MKFKKIIATILIFPIIMSTAFPVSAWKKKTLKLTAELIQEYLSTDKGSKQLNYIFTLEAPYNNPRDQTIRPEINGDFSLGKLFDIPKYNFQKSEISPEEDPSFSFIIQDNCIKGIIPFSIINDVLHMQNVWYLPDEFIQMLQKDSNVALFMADLSSGEILSPAVSASGTLLCAVDSENNYTIVSITMQSYFDRITEQYYVSKMTEYENMSQYNTIKSASSVMMNVNLDIDTSKYTIKDGDTILLGNAPDAHISGNFNNYKNTRRYIVHEVGKDENGEMIYTLSTTKEDNENRDGTKLYIRCGNGFSYALYKICSVKNPDRVLMVKDGKLTFDEWTYSKEQLWYIYKEKTVRPYLYSDST